MVFPATLLLAAVVIPDIEYDSPGAGSTCGLTEGNEPCNRLDIWLADDPLAGAPTILWVHGGGWQRGDKSGGNSSGVTEVWTAAGYNCVAANFTLSEPEGAAPSWPQNVYDLKAVIAWIRTEGVSNYGLSSRIAACGNSSGGHLSQLLAVTADVLNPPEVAPPPGCDGFRVQSAQSVAGAGALTGMVPTSTALPDLNDMLGLDWDGGETVPPLVIEASPITYVDATDSPMASYHATEDGAFPLETDLWFHDALEAATVHNALHTTPGGHNWNPWGGREATVLMWIEELPSLLAGDRAPQDINRDGCVDIGDLVLFLASYGACEGCCADFDADDTVGIGDLLLLLQAWGCG